MNLKKKIQKKKKNTKKKKKEKLQDYAYKIVFSHFKN